MRTVLDLIPILFLAGACAPLGPPRAAAVTLTAAETALEGAPRVVRVGRTRTLATQVYVGRPLELELGEDRLTVAFVSRGHHESTLTIDPVSLEASRATDPAGPAPAERFVRPSHESQNVLLDDGLGLYFWMRGDGDRGYKLFVKAHAGAAVEVTTGTSEVLGSIQAARIDGRHAVVAFYASDHDQMDLMAAQIEVL